jgi:alkaline phosphatase
MATGVKTNDRFIGVDYESRPRVTTMQAAKLLGKSTGIIANSNIQHATPGGWTAHTHNRSWFCVIGEQQVYGLFDVMLGGGSRFLQPPYRQDGENILESARDLGYQIVTTGNELAQINSGRVLGLFADNYLHFHLDKQHLAPQQPTLSEMTAKAMQILSQNPNGFFLMVEDSLADWSQHANDPVATVTNLIEFDKAVRMGLDFAKANQDTLVLILSDHGVGGLSIGDYQTGGYSRLTPWTYPSDPVQKFIAPLHRARLTGNGIPFKFNEDFTNVREVLAEWFGIDDITAEEYQTIREYIDRGYLAEPWGMNYALGAMISRRAFLGWTTFGHTGEEINLFSYFPGGSKLTGTIENTDIALVTAGVWGVDLDALTGQHFIDAGPAFIAKGATIEVQNADVRSGGILVVTKGDITIEIPENKNYVIRNGERIEVDLVNVHMPTIEKFFVSQKVLDLLP